MINSGGYPVCCGVADIALCNGWNMQRTFTYGSCAVMTAGTQTINLPVINRRAFVRELTRVVSYGYGWGSCPVNAVRLRL